MMVFPMLAQHGVEFDSSIVPVKYWRYGFLSVIEGGINP